MIIKNKKTGNKTSTKRIIELFHRVKKCGSPMEIIDVLIDMEMKGDEMRDITRILEGVIEVDRLQKLYGVDFFNNNKDSEKN